MLQHVINKLNGSQKCWGQRAQTGEGQLKCLECTTHLPCDCAASKIESAVKMPSHWMGQSSIWVGTDPPRPNHSYVCAYVWECECVFVFNVLTGAFCWSVWYIMKTRALEQSVLSWMSNVEGTEHFAWEKRFIQEVNKVYVVYLFICIFSDISMTPGSSGYLHSAPKWRPCRVCVPVVHNYKRVCFYMIHTLSLY